MKKLIAVLAAMILTVCCVSAVAESKIMTREDAIDAVLDYADLREEQVTFIKVERDSEDGHQIYEVEFMFNGIEYEFEVDMLTGRITKCDMDDPDDSVWDNDWFDFD